MHSLAGKHNRHIHLWIRLRRAAFFVGPENLVLAGLVEAASLGAYAPTNELCRDILVAQYPAGATRVLINRLKDRLCRPFRAVLTVKYIGFYNQTAGWHWLGNRLPLANLLHSNYEFVHLCLMSSSLSCLRNSLFVLDHSPASSSRSSVENIWP